MNTSNVPQTDAQAKPEHTPEPWQAFRMVDERSGEPLRDQAAAEYVAGCIAKRPGADFYAVAQPGEGTPDVCHTGNGPASAANAARIVACVNACAGVADLSDVKVDELMDIAQAGYALATYAAAAKDCGNTPEFMDGLERRIQRVRAYFETGANAGGRR